MSEMFEAIERNATERAERERIAQEEQMTAWKKAKVAQRRKATRGLLIRTLVVIALCVAMSFACSSGLMDLTLTRWISVALVTWLAFWIGAWFQFMWCKGGLLEC